MSAKALKKTALRLRARAIIVRLMLKMDRINYMCHLLNKLLHNRVQLFHHFVGKILKNLNPVQTYQILTSLTAV